MSSDWVRTFLRRFGIGERRWIPDDLERDEHRRAVRGRLQGGREPHPGVPAAADPNPVAQEDAPR